MRVPNGNDPSLDLCRLCEARPTAEESHILPKFVGKSAKRAGKNRLVALSDVRRIVQDTEKLPFLCEVCEGLFEAVETPFAKSWFHRYPIIPSSQAPDDGTVRFYLSVAWRALRLLIEKEAIPEQSLEDARGTECVLRNCLLNRTSTPPWNAYLFYASDFCGVQGAPSEDLLRYACGFEIVLFSDQVFIVELPIRPAIISVIGPFIHVLEMQPSEAVVNTKPEEWEGFRVTSGSARLPTGTPPMQLTRALTRMFCTSDKEEPVLIDPKKTS
jgi:hypothetical protein